MELNMFEIIIMNNANASYKCDWASFWQRMNPLFWKIFSRVTTHFVLRSLKNLEIKSMLELGGGSGLTAKRLSQKLGAQLTLLDNDPGAYRVFQKFSNYGEYLQENLFSFQTDRRWDLVYSLGVIEHFPKEKRIEAIKIHKNLSKKYVLVAVPKDLWLRRILIRRKTGDTISFEKLYSLDELKQEFQEAGLKPWRVGKNIYAVWILSKIQHNV